MLKTDSKKLETRDFISVGIFSLIYSVVAFVIGGVAQMTPVTFPFMPMIVALFTGTVFMLYVAKIPKKGALSILGVIAAILLFITGMFWMMSVFFLVFGLIADFICASADFRSFKKNLLAYPAIAAFDAMTGNGISREEAAAFLNRYYEKRAAGVGAKIRGAMRICGLILGAAGIAGMLHWFSLYTIISTELNIVAGIGIAAAICGIFTELSYVVKRKNRASVLTIVLFALQIIAAWMLGFLTIV